MHKCIQQLFSLIFTRAIFTSPSSFVTARNYNTVASVRDISFVSLEMILIIITCSSDWFLIWLTLIGQNVVLLHFAYLPLTGTRKTTTGNDTHFVCFLVFIFWVQLSRYMHQFKLNIVVLQSKFLDAAYIPCYNLYALFEWYMYFFVAN